MSRGPGIIEQRLVAAVEKALGRTFTIEELTARAYPGEELTRDRLDTVRRVARKLAERRSWYVGRDAGPFRKLKPGEKKRPWHLCYGKFP
jgi:hypothetical protein